MRLITLFKPFVLNKDCVGVQLNVLVSIMFMLSKKILRTDTVDFFFEAELMCMLFRVVRLYPLFRLREVERRENKTNLIFQTQHFSPNWWEMEINEEK